MTVIIIIDTAIRSGYEETKGCHCQGDVAFRQTSETLSQDQWSRTHREALTPIRIRNTLGGELKERNEKSRAEF